MHVDDATVV